MMSRTSFHICFLALTALSITSCKKDEVETEQTQQLRLRIEYNTLTASTNYFDAFKDQSGVSTVDFSGQTTRQDMMAEIDSVMRIPTGTHAAKGVPASAVSAALLKNMYANTGSPFRQAGLNAATDKQLKAKTAGSLSAVDAEAARQRFDAWLEKVAAASASFDKAAADGQAGIATSGTSKYLVDEKGIEYGQLVQKGLIGAVLMDQIVNVYLGAEKQGLDNSKVVDGKNYTAREHSWDEAYGYLTKNAVFPTQNPADATKYLERYLGNYVRPVGNPADLFLAYLKGRAAVVNNDNATRDAQIALIRQHIEKALGTFAVSYLNQTKSKTANADLGGAMHAFGEGAGFVYALRFANNPKINAAKSEELLNKLIGGAKGFYSLTPAVIDEVRNEIAAAFNIDPATVVGH